MKILSIILLPFLLCFVSSENIFGVYEYKQNKYVESIELFENNTFIYKHKEEFLNYSIKGNFNIKGDSLVLDSNPQRDKIIVREKNTGKFENKTFKVTDKKGSAIIFHLHLTLKNDSQKVFKDCFEKLKIKDESIKSFHIVSTNGLKSTEYLIKEEFANVFDIQFETVRVFENENWHINPMDKKIRPRGVDGEIQNYYLSKK